MLSHGGYPEKLRRIKYYDQSTQQTYVFLTNNLILDAKIIADLYKERWKVELFFKWIKQHLEVQVFWGTSEKCYSYTSMDRGISLCFNRHNQEKIWDLTIPSTKFYKF